MSAFAAVIRGLRTPGTPVVVNNGQDRQLTLYCGVDQLMENGEAKPATVTVRITQKSSGVAIVRVLEPGAVIGTEMWLLPADEVWVASDSANLVAWGV